VTKTKNYMVKSLIAFSVCKWYVLIFV